LVELAEASGVPARTIRFYIAKGLVPPPLVGGRAACYGEEHLKELAKIKTLQEEGQTLAQITSQLGERPKELSFPEPSAWWNYPVSKDVVVQVRCDSSPWRLKQVHSLIAQMIQQLNENEGNDKAR
jgi:DNA-binding transcriptional MerR regulator